MSVPAIIGGAGLDDPEFLEERRETPIETPYGEPSSVPVRGLLSGREVVLLSRHGRQHTIPPSRVNNRANLWALQTLGCGGVISTAACGSLRGDIGRGAIGAPPACSGATRIGADRSGFRSTTC